MPDNLRLYGSVTNRANLQQKCRQIQSLELTKSSANAVESNADISECNSWAFSFPILDAITRNWASSAASRARQTVTEKILWQLIGSCHKSNNQIQHRDYPGFSALEMRHLYPYNNICILKKRKNDKPWKSNTWSWRTNAFFNLNVFHLSKWNEPLYTDIFCVLLTYIVPVNQNKAGSISKSK